MRSREGQWFLIWARERELGWLVSEVIQTLGVFVLATSSIVMDLGEKKVDHGVNGLTPTVQHPISLQYVHVMLT